MATVLTLVAGTLTAVRIAGSEDGPWVQAVALVPWAIPACAAALGLLLLAIALPGRRHVRSLSFWAAAVVGVLALHLVWWGPMLVDDAPEADGSGLSVMTVNLFQGEGDSVQAFAAARAHDVDVLVLEEVTVGDVVRMDLDGLADTYPYSIGTARPDGLTDGTVVFSRIPLGPATRVPTIMQSWLVDVGTGDDAVTLLAVHPAAPVDPPTWRREHALIRAVVADRHPDLVVGDFNATLDHLPMRRLLALGYADATEQSGGGWQPTWPSNGLGPASWLPPFAQIDHVLVASSLAARHTQAVEITGTDHRGLVAYLTHTS
ncbi:endonuclease/exonuclease/phosphatase family protein [Nocardioides acrostichi]|uniref:Endonuclease/exonuclease/phosphatase family protein n=1 Tax=Nocardioides acrostichi TaxID=2784339 RepID=A0A930UT30_9ACTN|nr:endonuclease/exonuclease/phosphatase family protein [Nocardioides acrostichi]MBF4160338.1 endonuclease/exonuclease/phosphatase family protein [Nocardioides acrostichi]